MAGYSCRVKASSIMALGIGDHSKKRDRRIIHAIVTHIQVCDCDAIVWCSRRCRPQPQLADLNLQDSERRPGTLHNDQCTSTSKAPWVAGPNKAETTRSF